MATSGASSHGPKVVVYSTPTCPWCQRAKLYLTEHGIAFRDLDVSKDRRARREMLLMTGSMAVPVIQVGEHAMKGWDPREFEQLWRGRVRRR